MPKIASTQNFPEETVFKEKFWTILVFLLWQYFGKQTSHK
jgi:hypothetical protein